MYERVDWVNLVQVGSPCDSLPHLLATEVTRKLGDSAYQIYSR